MVLPIQYLVGWFNTILLQQWLKVLNQKENRWLKVLIQFLNLAERHRYLTIDVLHTLFQFFSIYFSVELNFHFKRHLGVLSTAGHPAPILIQKSTAYLVINFVYDIVKLHFHFRLDVFEEWLHRFKLFRLNMLHFVQFLIILYLLLFINEILAHIHHKFIKNTFFYFCYHFLVEV